MNGDTKPDPGTILRDGITGPMADRGESMEHLRVDTSTSQQPVSILGWGLAFAIGAALWALIFLAF